MPDRFLNMEIKDRAMEEIHRRISEVNPGTALPALSYDVDKNEWSIDVYDGDKLENLKKEYDRNNKTLLYFVCGIVLCIEDSDLFLGLKGKVLDYKNGEFFVSEVISY